MRCRCFRTRLDRKQNLSVFEQQSESAKNILIWGRIVSVEPFKVVRMLVMSVVSWRFSRDTGLAKAKIPTVMKTAKIETMRENCMIKLFV